MTFFSLGERIQLLVSKEYFNDLNQEVLIMALLPAHLDEVGGQREERPAEADERRPPGPPRRVRQSGQLPPAQFPAQGAAGRRRRDGPHIKANLKFGSFDLINPSLLMEYKINNNISLSTRPARKKYKWLSMLR